jgi:hypothetical protein
MRRRRHRQLGGYDLAQAYAGALERQAKRILEGARPGRGSLTPIEIRAQALAAARLRWRRKARRLELWHDDLTQVWCVGFSRRLRVAPERSVRCVLGAGASPFAAVTSKSATGRRPSARAEQRS